MSTAPFSRPRPVPVGDPFDRAAFRDWLVGLGYADSTARLWSFRVRRALAVGIEDPADVDGLTLAAHTRGTLRSALREYAAFVESREAV